MLATFQHLIGKLQNIKTIRLSKVEFFEVILISFASPRMPPIYELPSIDFND